MSKKQIAERDRQSRERMEKLKKLSDAELAKLTDYSLFNQ
jgi:hypothetical protein